MRMTLHLTNGCNLSCKYCYQTRNPQRMSLKTALAALEYSKKRDNNAAICFFGGEPLLEKELLYKIMDKCEEYKSADKNYRTSFKLVTNGVLMDEDYLKFANKHGIATYLSHDGLMHDNARIFPDGKGSAELLDERIDLLLKYQPTTSVLMTVTPENVTSFASSVEWLFKRGFKKIFTTPQYGRECAWDDHSANLLAREYSKIADWYIECLNDDNPVHFAEFYDKILSHIEGENYPHKTCNLGERQVSVLPNGKIYPCLQFIGEDEWEMGDVFSGVSMPALDSIRSRREAAPLICDECALKSRCKYNCACLNKQCTGRVDDISPFQCAHQQMLIFAADKAGSVLSEQGNTAFIKKYYEKNIT